MTERTRRMREEAGAPGLAFALASPGGELEVEASGARDAASGEPVTDATLFAVASVSKLFAALVALSLSEEGALDLDAPVTRWLPGLRVPHARSITAHHLLTHTAGLPGLPARYHALDRNRPGVFTGGVHEPGPAALDALPEKRAGFRDAAGLIEFLNGLDFEPLAAPGTLHSYSNEGYVLLSGVLEAAGAAPYPELVRRRVLEPLDLTGCAPGYDALGAGAIVATRHVPGPGGAEPVAPWDAPAWLAPGGMLATAGDLVRLLAALGEGHLLHRESVGRLTARHAQSLHADGEEHYGYGVGVVDHRAGVTWLHHDGGQVGVSSAFAWIPERGLAAAAVANSEGELPERRVRAALHDELGLPPDAPLVERERRPADAESFADCVGRYATPEGRSLEFVTRDERFGLRVGDAFVPLDALGPDHVALAHHPFRFLRRGGQVWATAVASRVVRRTS